jgi:hypothetical protein
LLQEINGQLYRLDAYGQSVPVIKGEMRRALSEAHSLLRCVPGTKGDTPSGYVTAANHRVRYSQRYLEVLAAREPEATPVRFINNDLCQTPFIGAFRWQLPALPLQLQVL